jgi:hypothetical protein
MSRSRHSRAIADQTLIGIQPQLAAAASLFHLALLAGSVLTRRSLIQGSPPSGLGSSVKAWRARRPRDDWHPRSDAPSYTGRFPCIFPWTACHGSDPRSSRAPLRRNAFFGNLTAACHHRPRKGGCLRKKAKRKGRIYHWNDGSNTAVGQPPRRRYSQVDKALARAQPPASLKVDSN